MKNPEQFVNAHIEELRSNRAARDYPPAPMAEKSLPERRVKRGGGRRAAVMVDVAKLAGVSYQTVSRVLHDSPHVRRDTRERVLDAIRQLDYRPSSVAQALVTGRSRTLGVVSFDTTLYGPASTLLGLEEAAHDAGYGVSISSLKSFSRAPVLEAVQRLRDQGADGIVVIAPQRSAVDALRHVTSDVPVVAVEGGPDDSVPVVAVDQLGGAVSATRHLLDLGHKTVWHIAGPTDWLEADQRIDGWRSALQAAGAEVPPLLRGDWSARSGYELAPQLTRTPGVTAVFVANDQMALGLLRFLHENGRETPRDLSVVGFDDIPEAAYFTPPLTTVRQDFSELGRRCLHVLLGQIESGQRSWSRVVVETELVVRKSTAVPRRR
jgi:DNA-binding LacI/PurR family transcriptional regulator